MSASFDASERRWNLFALAVCLSPFIAPLDQAVTVRYERWRVQKVCVEHYFDMAINISRSSSYPAWECRVRGPTRIDGIEPAMEVPLYNAERFELEAINFRRTGVAPIE